MVMTMVPRMVSVLVTLMVIQWNGRMVIAAFWIGGGVASAMAMASALEKGGWAAVA